MAHKAGSTVTVKPNYTARADRTGLVLSTDRDGTLEIAFADGTTNYFDAWEVEA